MDLPSELERRGEVKASAAAEEGATLVVFVDRPDGEVELWRSSDGGT